MKTSSALVCLLVLFLMPAYGQTTSKSAAAGAQPSAMKAPQEQPSIDPAKVADIRKLLDLSGTKGIMNQMMDTMGQNIKPLMTNSLPPGEYREKLVDLFYARFREKADVGQLLDKAVVAYDKYFSHEEIKGLIEFYRTPLGQKTVSVLPKVTAEMAEIGRKWGEELGRQSMLEVLAEHPDLAQALEAASKPNR